MSWRDTIAAEIQQVEGSMGVAVEFLERGEHFAHRADEWFPMASVFKVPLLIELFRQRDAGEINLHHTMKIPVARMSPGGGLLRHLSPELPLSIHDLATLMIILSDNTSTDVLLELVGADRVQQTMRAYGFAKISVRMSCKELIYGAAGLENRPLTPANNTTANERLRSYQLDLQSPVYQWNEQNNVVTPHEMNNILKALHRETILTPQSCREVLAILEKQLLNSRLPLLLPRQATLAHKTGSLPYMRADTGLLTTPKGRAVLSTFGKELAHEEQAVLCMARIGRIVYDELQRP
jgi:beta-lactamase class A